MPSRASGYGGYPSAQRPAYGAGRAQRPAYGGGRASAGKSSQAPPSPRSAPALQLTKGDMVDHKAFGRGMVLNLQLMGGDTLAEIAFDNVGTKRLLLKSASAHMSKV